MECYICKKQTQNVIKYSKYIKRDGSISQRYMCNDCNTLRHKKYRTTDSGKQAIRKAVKRYEKSHPERRSAWNAASNITKLPCEVCGKKNTHRHHADPYNRLLVVFLCPLHHKMAHKKEA